MYEFPCTGPITANVHLTSGFLHVIAESRDTAQVTVVPTKDNENGRAAAEAIQVEMSGTTLTVAAPTSRGFGFIRRGGDVRVEVRIPLESSVEAHAASADMVFEGRLATATVEGASSDVRLEFVSGDLAAESASGDIEVGFVGGNGTVRSASGDLNVDTIGGDASIRSASGDITIGSIGGSATVNAASGDIKIGSCVRGETRINTASGDVRIGVAEGTAVWLDLNTVSGDSRSDLPVSDSAPSGTPPTLTLHVRTVSGDINVKRAARVPDAPRPVYGMVQDLAVQDRVSDSVEDALQD